MDTSRVKNIPKTAYYIPNAISEVEENEILQKVYGAPKPKWKCLSNRRLQNWGGIPHLKGMIAEPIPEWLLKYMNMTFQSGAFPEDRRPNHVLINEYLPGQGIMPHFDGPLYYPVICTISCGADAVLNYHKPNEKEVSHKLFLERRSLVIVQNNLYHDYQHSISASEEDIITEDIANLQLLGQPRSIGQTLVRDTRVSLTIRHVPSTSKFKLKLSN